MRKVRRSESDDQYERNHARLRLAAHGLLVAICGVAPTLLVILLAFRDLNPWTVGAIAAVLEVAGLLLLQAARGP
jgi:hypothetical protein